MSKKLSGEFTDETEFTYVALKSRHPLWLEENFVFILRKEDYLERIRAEVLLENKCVVCKKEMGRHSWNKDHFEHPKEVLLVE